MQKAKVYQFPKRRAKPAGRTKSPKQLQNGKRHLAKIRELIEEGRHE